MKTIILSLTFLFTLFAWHSNASADALTFCKQMPKDPAAPNTVNDKPSYADYGSGWACLDVTNYIPSWDHDNNPYTYPQCFASSTAPMADGVMWFHVVVAEYADSTPTNPHHKWCSSYYSLPGKRCTGSGVSNSGRLVRRYGPTSLTFQSLVSLGLDPTDYCADGSYTAPASPIACASGPFYTTVRGDGCCNNSNGWVHIKNPNGTCAKTRLSVDPPSPY